jgi:hypothetical protein
LLLSGEVSLGVSKDARSPKRCSPGGEWTVGAARFRRTQGEVSRGHSTGGDEEEKPGRAERTSAREISSGSQGETMKAANPRKGPWRVGIG